MFDEDNQQKRMFGCAAASALRSIALVAALLGTVIFTVQLSTGQTKTILYSFKGAPDGSVPVGDLILGPKAVLYGTTIYGGSSNLGTVFELTKEGVETPLYNFTGGSDGANPNSKLVRDALGNLYGTTVIGGPGNFGTVFTISRTGNEQVLYTFTGGNDGAYPNGIVGDSKGNLYGSSQEGGAYGWGVVFKLEPTGVETVLHSFTGGTDGGSSEAGVLLHAGKLYGTTTNGGGTFPCVAGCGVVFELTLKGTDKVLHTFTGGSDGGWPQTQLVRDAEGNLYGTNAVGSSGYGTVFEITIAGAESTLHSFTGRPDGAPPNGRLVMDKQGNLFGTTNGGGVFGYGAIYEIPAGGDQKVLYSFGGGSDGANPDSGLILDAAGNLYGTTSVGGAFGAGTVFRLTP